ncbi:MAG TPA: hypothetical protein VIK01_15095 [Polyangiaceae bacterium]
MNAGAKTELAARAPDEADEVSARVVRALDENARLARATMLAIDRYVETMVRFLTAGPGGPAEARRRATALGLHRLEDYLSRRMTETGMSASARSTRPEPPAWEKES